MMKLVENIHYTQWPFTLLDWDELSPKRRTTLSRRDRKYQGWSELAAFYLDRVMGFYKKPPITGRVISSQELYRFDSSISARLLRLLPSFPIRVSMHGWVSGLHNQPPSNGTMEYLVSADDSLLPSLTSSSPSSGLEQALRVSDALVFDFLIDGT